MSEAAGERKTLYWLRLALVCAVALAVGIYALGMKRELHTDEYVAYVIANHTGEPASMFAPDDLTRYDDPALPYMRDMTVQSGEGFRFAQVCRNDATDTNPPLHYILLHTVCSFFPGQFSYWFGGAINLLFLVLSVIFLYKLALLLGCSEGTALISALLFAVLPGVLEIVQFIRMYTMCMFFCIWLTYGQARLLKSERFTLRLALGLALPTACGALTHYYFLLFAAFQCVCVGVYLLCRRRWRDAGFYALCFVAAAAVTLAVFPQMIGQMFGGRLTGSSIDNLTQTGDMLARLKGYFFVINTRLFGGYLPELALACLLALFIAPIAAKKPISAALGALRGSRDWLLCVIVPCGLYFLLVTKISFFSNTRYMCLIYPFIVCVGVEALGRLLSVGMKERRALNGLVCLLCVVAALGSLRAAPPASLEYSGSDASRINAMREYSELDALCVYDAPWSAETTYNLNKDMNGLVFVKEDGLDGVAGALNTDKGAFIAEIRSTMDADAIIKRLLALYPDMSGGELIANDYFYDLYLIR